MNLPQAAKARVEHEKIAGYLLNHNHPGGHSKATFSERFGFRAANWQQLAEALRNQALRSPVSDTVLSSYGTRYIVEGPIETPTGEHPQVRTVAVVTVEAGDVRPVDDRELTHARGLG